MAEAIELLAKSNKEVQECQPESYYKKAQNLLTALRPMAENILKVGQFLVERQWAYTNTRNRFSASSNFVKPNVGLSSIQCLDCRGRYLLLRSTKSNNSIGIALRFCTSREDEQHNKFSNCFPAHSEESPTNAYTVEQLAC